MAYAEHTKVPAERTMSEIIKMLRKAGANQVGQFEGPDKIAVQFSMEDRMVRFTVSMPLESSDARRRQRARALMLVIKAKLESVESEIETAEQAFFAHIVTPNGRTVYEEAAENVARGYLTGAVQPLLPGW
jgi:hypothetical protein